MPIDLQSVNASAQQSPGAFTYGGRSSLPESAVNGRLENNSGPGDGVLHCASTESYRRSQVHWFQVDLKGEYFVTEIVLWLREGPSRQSWQSGLTTYVSNTPMGLERSAKVPVVPGNRCGERYTLSQGKGPVFPCYFDFPTQYVILTLKPTADAGLQLCEMTVFGKEIEIITIWLESTCDCTLSIAATCDEPPQIDHASLESPRPNYFAPATVNFQCDVGYQLVGRGQAKCGKTGRWEGRDLNAQLCQQVTAVSSASRVSTTTVS